MDCWIADIKEAASIGGCMARSQLQLTVFVEPDTATKKYGAEQVDLLKKPSTTTQLLIVSTIDERNALAWMKRDRRINLKYPQQVLAADLAQRDEDGNPIRVCIIGAGEMGHRSCYGNSTDAGG